MNSLKPAEQAYWESFLQRLSPDERPVDAFVSAGYAGTPEITDSLLAFYLEGKKVAGSSVLEDFLAAGDPPPAVGNYWILLNGEAVPSLILRTDKIVMHQFCAVPAEIAVAEGEGDLSLAYWRKVHGELWAPHLSAWSLNDLDSATVVTEFFSIVYR